jgi:biopolymer transport protein ExbD
MSASRFRDDDYTHEINMIPLIDVMLVLLVVFLVTAPLMQSALEIQLPSTVSKAVPAPLQHVVVSIGADGRYAWDGHIVTWQTLSEKIVNQGLDDPRVQMRVQADQSVPFEKVAEVLGLAQNSGLSQIAVMTVGTPSPLHRP